MPPLHRAIPDYSTAYPCHFRSVLIKAYPLQFHCFLCLALACLIHSSHCFSTSFHCCSTLCHRLSCQYIAIAFHVNTLPLPFMSKPLQIKSLLVLTLPLRIKSHQNYALANHHFAYPLQIIVLLFTALLFLCEPILFSALTNHYLSKKRFTIACLLIA